MGQPLSGPVCESAEFLIFDHKTTNQKTALRKHKNYTNSTPNCQDPSINENGYPHSKALQEPHKW